MTNEEALNVLFKYAQDSDTDLFAYIGPVDRFGYDEVCKRFPEKRRRNCLLAICTFGGDANAGYRIARAFSHNYPPDGTISVLVPDYCKSAGTVICIGAHELIIADRGELGPLDIQVRKPDEMFQQGSGLDIIRGLTYLYDGVLSTFREYLIEINQGSGLSTKAASEIASKLTIGIHEPVFAQIDPLRLGEMQAALTIALDYGTRLDERTRNLKAGALHSLTSGYYPSHGFVIDRKEARQLFTHVRPPTDVEGIIAEWAAFVFNQDLVRRQPVVVDVIAFFSAQVQATSRRVASPSEPNANADAETNPSAATREQAARTANDAAPQPDEPTARGNQKHCQTGEGESG